ncbi:MAG: ABC transporter ATP-binding protein, partial [Deltaproteobacteria bacterium]
PTNHLDIKTKEILLLALSEYKGTLLIVSHDRYFLDNLVNRIIEVKDESISDYAGNYSYYIEKRSEYSSHKNGFAIAKKSTPISIVASKSKEQRREDASKRNSIYKIRQELDAIENSISMLEDKKKEIESLLCKPDILKDSLRVKAINVEYRSIIAEIEKFFDKWEATNVKLSHFNTS